MKVTVIAAISANGIIAQRPEQSSIDWTSGEDTEHFKEITKRAGVVIVGRKTFELIGKPLADRQMIVLTKTPEAFGQMDGVRFTNQGPAAVLKALKEQNVQEVAVIGGQETYTQFFDQKLVTDLYLTIEPLLFGEGMSLVKGFDRVDLRLESIKRLGDQAVLLHYVVS